jgi:hypothetical protein
VVQVQLRELQHLVPQTLAVVAVVAVAVVVVVEVVRES